MTEYTLRPSTDIHGQPLRLFKANRDNNVSKAIDQLSGICAGILADGVVNQAEAEFFHKWLSNIAPDEPVWPFTDIVSRVERIFADGKCDDEERQELKGIMEALTGHKKNSNPTETYSTALPLDTPPPAQIVFRDRTFHITGRFAFGTRQKVMEAIHSKGGTASASAPNKSANYLVIGVFASRDWINTNYGRKIERAVELRESGTGIAIVSEEHWRRFAA